MAEWRGDKNQEEKSMGELTGKKIVIPSKSILSQGNVIEGPNTETKRWPGLRGKRWMEGAIIVFGSFCKKIKSWGLSKGQNFKKT